MRILADYFRVQVKLGILRAIDPEVAAPLFHGLIMGPYMLPAQLGCEPTPALRNLEKYVKEAVRVFLAAYGCPDMSKQDLPQNAASGPVPKLEKIKL